MSAIGVAIIEILQQLLAAAGSSLGPERPVDEYLPTPAKLAASMPNAASRETKIKAYLDLVRPRYEQAVALGLVARLEQARAIDQTMKSGAAGVTKPLEGLPRNTVNFFYEKLVLDNRSAQGETVIGRDLLSGATNPAAHNSSSKAVRAIMSLRHVDDVLTRVLAAQQAATALVVPLSEVMAMYRTEGDLNAPPSASSLGLDGTSSSLEIPPGITNAPSLLGPSWPGWVDVSHLVAIRRNDLTTRSDDQWRLIGMVAWCVQIAGLDVIGKAGNVDAPNGVDDTLDKLRHLSSTNRSLANLPKATIADAETRFDDALANMIVAKRTSHGKEAVIIAPEDPIALIDFVLQEAIALQRQLMIFQKEPLGHEAVFDLRLDRRLSYLRYHQEETFKAYLVRAALAANEQSSLQYSELRRELQQDFDLQTTFAQIGSVTTIVDQTKAVSMLNGGWPALVTWFTTAPTFSTTSRFDLLAEFLKTADSSVWRTWPDGRGNMSRYSVLLDYYERLFP